ncbi:unnamed protein product [Trichogramma brassicae]|uniref:Uncharacterized protein n=1 Tax=Trichogramma brassicae TaxID=86971 RepID=A0A6H5I212_9HYME|nr:unnamed protein product [Trichogramma brassicae]
METPTSSTTPAAAAATSGASHREKFPVKKYRSPAFFRGTSREAAAFCTRLGPSYMNTLQPCIAPVIIVSLTTPKQRHEAAAAAAVCAYPSDLSWTCAHGMGEREKRADDRGERGKKFKKICNKMKGVSSFAAVGIICIFFMTIIGLSEQAPSSCNEDCAFELIKDEVVSLLAKNQPGKVEVPWVKGTKKVFGIPITFAMQNGFLGVFGIGVDVNNPKASIGVITMSLMIRLDEGVSPCRVRFTSVKTHAEKVKLITNPPLPSLVVNQVHTLIDEVLGETLADVLNANPNLSSKANFQQAATAAAKLHTQEFSGGDADDASSIKHQGQPMQQQQQQQQQQLDLVTRSAERIATYPPQTSSSRAARTRREEENIYTIKRAKNIPRAGENRQHWLYPSTLVVHFETYLKQKKEQKWRSMKNSCRVGPLKISLEPAAATSLNFMNSAHYSARCSSSSSSSSDPHEWWRRRQQQLCRYRARLALQRSRLPNAREIRGRKRNSTAAGLYQYNRKSICSAFYISWNCCCCCRGFARFLRFYSDDLHLDADSRYIKLEPRKAAIKQRPPRNHRSLRKIFRSRLAATRSMETRLIVFKCSDEKVSFIRIYNISSKGRGDGHKSRLYIELLIRYIALTTISDFLIPARIARAQSGAFHASAQLARINTPNLYMRVYVFSAPRDLAATGALRRRRRHWYVLKQRNNDFPLSLLLRVSTCMTELQLCRSRREEISPKAGADRSGVSCFSRKCLGNRSSCSAAAALHAYLFTFFREHEAHVAYIIYVYNTATRATFCTRRKRAKACICCRRNPGIGFARAATAHWAMCTCTGAQCSERIKTKYSIIGISCVTREGHV